MSEARKRFIKALTTGLTIGMVTTGCGFNNPFSTQSKEAKFATTEANDLNKFTDAYKAKDTAEMEKIIKDTQTQLDKLKDERDKAEKYQKDNFEELSNEYILLGNEYAVMTYAYGQQTGAATGNAQPKSTDFFTNAWNFATGVFDWVKGVVNGNPIPKATQSAVEYAKANPDWQPFADAMVGTYEEVFGQEFDYDAIVNGNNQNGTESGINPQDVVSGIGGAIQGAAGAIGNTVGEVASNAKNSFERANDEYNKQVQTDAYGNYVTVDPESLADQEKMQKLYEEGKIEVIPDPLNNGEFIWVYTEEGQEEGQEDDYERG